MLPKRASGQSVIEAMSGEQLATSSSSPALVLTNSEEQERPYRRASCDLLLDTSYEKLSEGQSDVTSSEHSAPSGADMNGDSLGNDRSKSGSFRSSGSSNLQAKRRNKSWYHALTANYKTKHQDFRRIFYGTPVSDNERLLVDFACALLKQQSGLLLQGRIYITENWICFFSKIIAYETKLTLDVRSIASLTKERTARVFPNAIQIVMERGDKYFFTSFGSRDRTYQILNRVVQTVQNGQSLPAGFLMPLGSLSEVAEIALLVPGWRRTPCPSNEPFRVAAVFETGSLHLGFLPPAVSDLSRACAALFHV